LGETARALILASSSPRRRELLAGAGFRFEVASPDVDETPRAGEAPEAMARRLALEKALAVARRADPASCVLGADTVVVLDREMLGKPRDSEEAAAMLGRLAGREHRVITGVAVVVRELARSEQRAAESRVLMARVTADQAIAYARTGEPLDKAGGYALQGEGARFVDSVVGSRSNVIGLPLELVLPLLADVGVRAACRT
jgi:septum formation protein